MYDGGGMLFGGGMWVFWILVIVAIIFGIKVAVGGNERNDNHAEESPLEILKKRYAHGEIDEEEFSRRRKDLEGHS